MSSPSNSIARESSGRSRRALVGCMVLCQSLSASAFCPPNGPLHQRTIRRFAATTNNSDGIEDDISRQLAKAKELVAKSKAKLAVQEEEEDTTPELIEAVGDAVGIPFFASTEASSNRKRDDVVISTNDDGLIRADGEKMAKLSEEEQWEARSLLEVFENEIDDTGDVYAATTNALAERDVAASIYNLRKRLQVDDYKRIFDKRNRFIGEDN